MSSGSQKRESSAPLISVIVSTYNRPDALAAVLRGLADQTDRNFETIVADDGSDPDTSVIAQRCGARHVWHPHDGFRAAMIRNRAVGASRGVYLIFLDGDCVPRPSFVGRHRALAETGWLVAGNRILMSEQATETFLKSGGHLPGGWLKARLAGDINRLAPLFTLPFPRKLMPRQWEGVMTCNLAMWREDFDRVGGLDESYVGWGYEDSDLAVRLFRAGVRRKDGRFATGVIHLWHPPNDQRSSGQNLNRFMRRTAGCQM